MSKAKIITAESGWHVVTILRRAGTLCIDSIQPVTHWRSDGHPIQNKKALFFDPDDIAHVRFVSYLMDPQGRLLGRDREVIANSVIDLQEQYTRRVQERPRIPLA